LVEGAGVLAAAARVASSALNPWLVTEQQDFERRKLIRENIDSRPHLRVGKWTKEEEAYTDRLVSDFDAGLLPLANGETLRPYLAEQLNCSGMVSR
jgi:hypothetical protein